MENVENWLYILGFVIYFLLQLRSARKKQNPTSTPEPQASDSPPKSGPITFEEVLKEILDERKQSPAPQPKAEAPVPSTPAKVVRRNSPMSSTSYDKTLRPKFLDQVDDEARSLELIPVRSKKFEHEKPFYAKLETNVPEVGLGADYQRGSIFKEFEVNKPKESKYAKMFRNPASLKEAIVAAEILKPKF
jgi:hypothetical protein